MKFTKGIIVGSMLTAGVLMMYSDNVDIKKMKKQGKQLIKKMRII